MRPHRCPVCEGRGTVDSGFYYGGVADHTAPDTCRSCNGSGVLWSYEQYPNGFAGYPDAADGRHGTAAAQPAW